MAVPHAYLPVYRAVRRQLDLAPKSHYELLIFRWGFQRISRGPETGAYYHKLFRCVDFYEYVMVITEWVPHSSFVESSRRDKPDYVMQMSSNSGSKYRAPAYPTPLLPNLQAGGIIPAAAAPQGVFPFVAPNMMGGVPMPMPMPNMFPGAAAAVTLQQQQQAMWQQQMQFMQFQMMQMQQQQQAMQVAMIHQQQPQPQALPQGQAQPMAYGMANPAAPTGPMLVAPSMAGTAPLEANANQQQQQQYQEPTQQQVADLSPVGEDGTSSSEVANIDAV
jgi:hypothetical protein